MNTDAASAATILLAPEMLGKDVEETHITPQLFQTPRARERTQATRLPADHPKRLSVVTLDNLRAYFATQGHHPSVDMWAALEDLAVTLEAMANETAAPKLFLSSLVPGGGKTQTIVKFIDALLTSPFYRDVGVLVCVARLSEVRNLAEEAAIPAEMLAVVTSDETVNAIGKAKPHEPQVLVTTQQM